jgi:hypothetical protein
MKTTHLFFSMCLILAWVGCTSVSDMERLDIGARNKEGTLVFARPGSYVAFGTHSLKEYVEVVYEQTTKVPETGNMRIQVGVRNRGGQHWYSVRAPDITIGAKASFFGTADRTVPVYQSSRRALLLKRGEVVNVQFDCPVAGANAYQIFFSDYVR